MRTAITLNVTEIIQGNFADRDAILPATIFWKKNSQYYIGNAKWNNVESTLIYPGLFSVFTWGLMLIPGNSEPTLVTDHIHSMIHMSFSTGWFKD